MEQETSEITENGAHDRSYIKRIALISVILITISGVVLLGLSVYRMVIAHDNLTSALSVRGGYKSNSVDPKPYLHKSQLDIPKTLLYYLKHPFTDEFRLIYIKRGYVVCRATLNQDTLRWYLLIPHETLWPKKKKSSTDEE